MKWWYSMESENSSSYDISLWNRRYLSFVNLIVTFWNCCLALFKSSLHSPEQSRYLRSSKIHSVKRGSHDRLHRLQDVICSCRPIEVIAIHVVNSSPNNPDYSRSSSFFLFFFLPPFCHLALTLLLRGPTRIAISRSAKRSIASTKYVLWRKLYEGTSTKIVIYPSRTPWPHTRREHLRPT